MVNEKDYLAEYDNADEEQKYPLVQKWMKEEPLPFFKQLREQRPVLVTPECTLVTSFCDVRDMLQMPKIFTAALYKPKMGVTAEDEGYLMAHDDDALHTREKSLMMGILNRDDLPHVRKLISESAIKILDDADGELDVIDNYTRTVPAILVQDYFGLDGIDKEDLLRWSYWNQIDAFHNQPFDMNSEQEFKRIIDGHAKATEELQVYIAVLVLRKLVRAFFAMLLTPIRIVWQAIRRVIYAILKREVPVQRQDIVTQMIRSKFNKHIDFPIKRIGVNAGGLLIGSIETTSQAVSQAIQYFMERPELLRKAKVAAAQPDTADIDAMVWEALRFVPISPYLFRQTAEDYTIAKDTKHETTIKAGVNVLLLTQSAMFDPYAFDDPDEYKPHRNWAHHFNLGFASHECLGKYIGMIMIPEMVRQVLLRSEIKAKAPIDYENGPFPEKYELQWSQ